MHTISKMLNLNRKRKNINSYLYKKKYRRIKAIRHKMSNTLITRKKKHRVGHLSHSSTVFFSLFLLYLAYLKSHILLQKMWKKSQRCTRTSAEYLFDVNRAVFLSFFPFFFFLHTLQRLLSKFLRFCDIMELFLIIFIPREWHNCWRFPIISGR